MGVTELALLRAIPPHTASCSDILPSLRMAKAALESFDKRPFFFYSDLDDPSLIYIIGSWPSVEQHMGEYLPSPVNQECLQLMKDQVQVEWMFHLDIDWRQIPFDEPSLTLIRQSVKRSKRVFFQEVVIGNKVGLSSQLGRHVKTVGGWRVDQGFEKVIDPGKDISDRENEEFVLFTGQTGQEQSLAITEANIWSKNANCSDLSKGTQVLHMAKMDI